MDVRTVRRAVGGSQVRIVRLAIVEGPDAGVTLSTEGTCAIGSAPDNEVVVRDPAVSRYHLELSPGAHGIAVIDLGSLNGTFLGGVRVERAVVPPGSRLTIGTTTFVVEDGGKTQASRVTTPEVPGLVGVSTAMRDVAALVAQLAPASVSALIQGETGTGKEVIARAIHDLGPRKDKPFVVVDCGSLPATLIGSELFGHERGAFTGADARRAGAFEQANGGTIFLDEVGELPLALQPQLLGVLERRRFRRLGGQTEITVDVRVVSATNRDLRGEANRGTFRPDLYFRLAVARITVPPLRERTDDIEPLLQHFVQQATGSGDTRNLFSAATLDALRAHHWSGNVRELRNLVERALAFGDLALESAPSVEPAEHATYKAARGAALAAFEREFLGRLMASCNNNASEAARRASMDRPYLLSLLKRHGLR